MQARARGTALVAFNLVLNSFVTTASVAQENLSEVQFVAHYIHIREGGGFLQKTFHEMDTTEATAALAVACGALGCSSAVPMIVSGIHNSQPYVASDIKTTGRIDKHAGEEWLIAFPAPAGYVTCNAAYDPKTISANGGDATSGTVLRNPQTGENWVSSYNEVPKNRPEGHWVNVNFVVKYVVAGSEDRHGCVPNGTRIWAVKL